MISVFSKRIFLKTGIINIHKKRNILKSNILNKIEEYKMLFLFIDIKNF